MVPKTDFGANSASHRTLLAVVAAATLLFGACTGGDESASNSEVIDLREDDATASDDTAETAITDQSDAPTVSDEPVEIIDDPAVRVEGQETVDATNWLARTYMDSSSVELVWSPVEGADTYRVLRLPTSEADYDAIAAGNLEGAEEVYDDLDEFFGFVDDDVPANTFLTYILVAEVDGQLTEPRWAEALTVDDVTPPAPVTGLTFEDTTDGVLLTWEPSPDDVEFAAYNVSILEDDGQFRYIGGGADVGQVSFLDDEAFTGTRTYVVAAVDFHNNVSTPAQVEVTR